ncbi:MAG: ligase-associated DNA damage response exonuclease, partial [Bacteroidetes bacterium]|nr:ligase-associated DNA damage response exonuclease [Bacteroidota bacterium]
YVPFANVYIDPFVSVDKAIVTHAHGDHIKRGCSSYLSHIQSIPILNRRLGKNKYEGVQYGIPVHINGVKFSFHPAGHILGSSQIRVEYKGEVWVASGDYKMEDDEVHTPFESIKCNTFITESTFGLPEFDWLPQQSIFEEINQWWHTNAEAGICSIIFAYSLGKAQRIIQHLNHANGPVFAHGSIENMNDAYKEAGIILKPTQKPSNYINKKDFRKALIIAPPSADTSIWLKKFEPYITAKASGWIGNLNSNQGSITDTGFALSDHADWKGLNKAVKDSQAQKVIVTHGYTSEFAQWLNQNGIEAEAVKTQFDGNVI